MSVKNTNELYEIVKSTFKYKAKMLSVSSEGKEVACILYDSFLFKCNINGNYGTFGGGISIGKDEAFITNFFGEKLSLNSDRNSISKSLNIIDEYCQLRLPDKFIKKFDKAYKDKIL